MGDSETSKMRGILGRYCIGDGVDVGFGGDPITPTAICLDMPKPYTEVGDAPQHIHGSACDLPFKDETLDYVYSSHLIEDFSYSAQSMLLHEWARVVRVGGLVVIVAPDQQRYAAYCKSKGEPMNAAHQYDFYGLSDFKSEVLDKEVFFDLDILMERDNVGGGSYSWCVVLEKKEMVKA